MSNWPLLNWRVAAAISGFCECASFSKLDNKRLLAGLQRLSADSPIQQCRTAYSLLLTVLTFVTADLCSIPIGQRLMRERPPFKLRRFAAVHNAVLFSLSLYMTVEVARQASPAKRQRLAALFGPAGARA